MYEQKMIELVHSVTGARHEFPDNPGVVEVQEGHGWVIPKPEPEDEDVPEPEPAKKAPAKKAASQKEGDEG